MNENLLDFYKGVDISFLPQFMDEGMAVRDFDGTVSDPFALLKKYGVNAVRLRLWHTPENVPESGGYCSLAQTIRMAKRVKESGMQLLLDFHYSDFWADPAKQEKPRAWESLSFAQLQEAVFSYTRDTLLAMEAEGVLPDMVQIGNEIRSGLLFPEGQAPEYGRMAQLLNAGIRGARFVAGPERLQVMIHLDQGGRYFYLKEWFSRAMEGGLEAFDLIGVSYYPFWHGTFADLKETLTRLVEEYHKPVLVVETAHAWRRSEHGFIDEAQEKIAGVEATPAGQRKVLEMVMNIVASLPEGMGRGIYYWEPLCVPKPGQGGWAENMGILDESGTLLEAVRAFGLERAQLDGSRTAKVYGPAPVTVPLGGSAALAKELPVLLYDGTIEKRPVRWELEGETFCPDQAGIYAIRGQVAGVQEPVTASVRAVEAMEERENLLQDPNWESGLAQWTLEGDREQLMAQIFPQFEVPFPAPPVNALRVEAVKPFTFRISQRVFLSQPGGYCLQAEFQGADTTGVDVRLFAEFQGRRWEQVIHPTEHGWEAFAITDMACQSGYMTVGICMTGPPIYGMMRKFCLTRIN